jgi:hypothetical protein
VAAESKARYSPNANASGRQLGATLAAPGREDGPPGAGAHAQPEPVGPRAATVVRLERTLALGHGCRSPGARYLIARFALHGSRCRSRSRRDCGNPVIPCRHGRHCGERDSPGTRTTSGRGREHATMPAVGGRRPEPSKPASRVTARTTRRYIDGACLHGVLVAAPLACQLAAPEYGLSGCPASWHVGAPRGVRPASSSTAVDNLVDAQLSWKSTTGRRGVSGCQSGKPTSAKCGTRSSGNSPPGRCRLSNVPGCASPVRSACWMALRCWPHPATSPKTPSSGHSASRSVRRCPGAWVGRCHSRSRWTTRCRCHRNYHRSSPHPAPRCPITPAWAVPRRTGIPSASASAPALASKARRRPRWPPCTRSGPPSPVRPPRHRPGRRARRPDSTRSTPSTPSLLARPTVSPMLRPWRCRKRQHGRTTRCSSGANRGWARRTAAVSGDAGALRLHRGVHQRLHQLPA